jgi:hypothetical protein
MVPTEFIGRALLHLSIKTGEFRVAKSHDCASDWRAILGANRSDG